MCGSIILYVLDRRTRSKHDNSNPAEPAGAGAPGRLALVASSASFEEFDLESVFDFEGSFDVADLGFLPAFAFLFARFDAHIARMTRPSGKRERVKLNVIGK